MAVFATLAGMVQASCKKTDVKTIIGGQDYEVRSIKSTLLTATNAYAEFISILIVAGSIQKDGETSLRTFFFTYSLMDCQAYDEFEITGMSEGIDDVSYIDKTVVIIGKNKKPGTGELFQVLLLIDATMEDQVVFDLDHAFSVEAPIPSDQAPFVGQYSTLQQNDAGGFDLDAIIFTQTDIQEFIADRKTVYKIADGKKIVASDYFIPPPPEVDFQTVIVVLTATDTFYSFFDKTHYETRENLLFSFKVPQDHGGDAKAQLWVEKTIQSRNCMIASAIYQHAGGAPTTLITIAKVSEVPDLVWAKEFAFDERFNVLSIDIHGVTTNVQVLALRDDNKLYKFTIDHQHDSLIDVKISAAITDLSSMLDTFSRAVFIPDFDHFIVGTTSKLTFGNTPVIFPHGVGFIMGVEKNRINNLLQPPASPSDFTIASVRQPQKVVNRETFLTQQPDGTSGPPNPQIDVFLPDFEKNAWISTVGEPCAKYESVYFKSECFYYAFLDGITYEKKKNLLVDPEVPTMVNACNQTDVMFLAPYASLSSSEFALRSTCYPIYYEYGDTIPSDGGNPMVIIDPTRFSVHWNATISPGVVNQNWEYNFEEFEDHNILQTVSQAPPLNFTTSFTSKIASNTDVTIYSADSWQKVLEDESDWGDYAMTVTCWSVRCSRFIHHNPRNLTLWTNAAETFGERVNGTYIYAVDLVDLENFFITRQTFTITMIESKNLRTQGLNITMPFELWSQLNKLPNFYAPPPGRPQKETKATELLDDQSLEDIVRKYGEESKSELEKWTKEEVAQAYKEARERVNRPIVDIQVKAKMDELGVLSIQFNQPVNYPSYLLEQARPSRDLNEVFFISTDFQYPTGAGKLSAYTREFDSQAEKFLTTFFKEEKTGGDLVKTYDEKRDDGKTGMGTKMDGMSGEGLLKGGVGGREGFRDGPGGGDMHDGEHDGPGGPGGPGGHGDGPDDGEFGPHGGGEGGPGGFDDYMHEIELEFANEGHLPGSTSSEGSQSFESSRNQQKDGQQQEIKCSPIEYKDKQTGKCEKLKIYFGTFDSLFSVQLVPADKESQAVSEERRRLSLQFTQEIIEVNQNEIKVRFNFTDPLLVQPEDQLKIKVNFGVFESGLPEDLGISIPCARQVPQGQATQTVLAVSEAATGASATAVVGTAIFKTVMSGALSQIWALINGMQLMIHLPAMNTSFPPNAFLLIKRILPVATLDVPYVNMESVPQYKVPQNETFLAEQDEQNLKNSMSELGYENPQISENLGTIYVTFLGYSVALVFVATMSWWARGALLTKAHNYLVGYLHWNPVIRLVLEGALEMAFCCYIQLRFGSLANKYFGAWFNYITTCALLVFLVGMPFWIMIFFYRKFQEMEEEAFQKKFGEVYEGLRTNERAVLFYPVYFIVRRILFMAITFFFYKFVVMQLALLTVTTMTSAIYLLHFLPFKEKLMNYLEVMNELFTLFLIYILFCFTDIIDKVRDKYLIGFIFIAAMCLCLLIHLYLLFGDLVQNLVMVCKRQQARRRYSRGSSKIRSLYQYAQLLGKKIADRNKKPNNEEAVAGEKEQDGDSERVQALSGNEKAKTAEPKEPADQIEEVLSQEQVELQIEEEDVRKLKKLSALLNQSREEAHQLRKSQLQNLTRVEIQIDTVNYRKKKDPSEEFRKSQKSLLILDQSCEQFETKN